MSNDETSTGLKWLFFDLNSYFASVEQQDRPHLRNRPVAVVPMETDSTCAIAASYEAKAYGVKTGTPIYEAKRLCPDLQCILARHDIYVAYHHRIIEEVIKHTPINNIWSIDELSSRLPPNKRTPDAASVVARRIKEGIRAHVGEAIKCSIGVAPNPFLAKVATDLRKPDGLTLLATGDLPGPLFDLKLIDLPGINVNMEARLRRSGITSVAQFWHLSPKHARRIWGSVEGERFWYNLHGYEVPEKETQRRVIGHSRVLDPELRRPDKARDVARRLTTKAASRLRREEFYATSFDLSVRMADSERRWAATARLSPARDNFTFLNALGDMWDTMLCECRPAKLKKVSVTLHGLCMPGQITPDLFDTTSQAHNALTERQEKLTEAMDNLNARYGSEAVRLGPSPRTRAGYVGTKIAFSRVPDTAEFNE